MGGHVKANLVLLLVSILILYPVPAAAIADVAIVPAEINVSKGQTFEFNISVDPKGTEIAGMLTDITFNAAVLRINSITEGNLFKQTGGSTWFDFSIDNSNGAINAFSFIVGRYNVTTPGIFATVSATVIDYSTSGINLSGSKVSRPNGTYIPLNITNGTVNKGVPISGALISIAVNSPLNWSYNTNSIQVNVTLNESGSWCGVSLNGTANQTMSNTSATLWYLDISAPAEGSNIIRVYCNNTAGNMANSSTIYFTIDTIPPAITLVYPTPNGDIRDPVVQINITSTKTLSNALLEWGGSNESLFFFGANWYTVKSAQPKTNYTFRVYGKDMAGNWNVTETRWVYLLRHFRYNFTVRDKTGQLIENATIRVYNDSADALPVTKLNAAAPTKYIDVEEAIKYHVKYVLPTGHSLNIRNVLINANTTLNPQFVDSYTGTLPQDTTAMSYAVALNDSGMAYDNAEITLSVSDTPNKILHCTNWDFSSATCSNWESSDLSAYNYTLESGNLTFNVTSFDAYMAGNYSASEQQNNNNGDGNTGGSSGGGGGGGGSPTTTKTVTITLDDVITKIVVNLKTAVSGASIAVLKLSDISVSAPAGTVYQYLEITKANFNNSDIESAIIEFRVARGWILADNISNIYLLRYDNGWNKLSTELLGSTENHNNYKAYTDGFGYFAIVGESPAKPGAPGNPITGRSVNPIKTNTTADTENPVGQSESNLLVVLLIGGFILSAIVLTRVLYKKRINNGAIEPKKVHHISAIQQPPESSAQVSESSRIAPADSAQSTGVEEHQENIAESQVSNGDADMDDVVKRLEEIRKRLKE